MIRAPSRPTRAPPTCPCRIRLEAQDTALSRRRSSVRIRYAVPLPLIEAAPTALPRSTPPERWSDLLASDEVDVRVVAVGRVIAGHQVGAAGVDDVEPTLGIEGDLEEVAEVEVAGGCRLVRIGQRVGHGGAELRRGAAVDVPVAVERGVGLVADADRLPVGGDVDPAVP